MLSAKTWNIYQNKATIKKKRSQACNTHIFCEEKTNPKCPLMIAPVGQDAVTQIVTWVRTSVRACASMHGFSPRGASFCPTQLAPSPFKNGAGGLRTILSRCVYHTLTSIRKWKPTFESGWDCIASDTEHLEELRLLGNSGSALWKGKQSVYCTHWTVVHNDLE